MRKLYAFWRCLLLDIKIVCTTLVTSECQYLSDFRSSTFDGVHAWTTQLASRAELAWIGLDDDGVGPSTLRGIGGLEADG
jgi:hypothetical protein